MFRILITTAALALLTGSTAAMAVAKPIVPYTQSCDTRMHGGSDWDVTIGYTAHIGITFADGKGCPGIKDALAAKVGGSLNDYSCKDDGYGDTMLTFSTDGNRNRDVSNVLEEMYPGVAGGFNCGDEIFRQPEKRSSAFDCPPLPNTSTCLTQGAFGRPFIYTVKIGVTFASGNGCSGIENALKDKLGSDRVDSYSCNNDGYDNTVLYFKGHGTPAEDINAVLQGIYPMVTSGFTCTNDM
ncbi:hypothetical protein LTR97_009305 [Elasticomyces elasticus]|uniref:Uncharacterized protein n=1 Tax=Elasticomyces elasticus TaxID=574655 RepID=A0AAN7ZS14_9PEZI|nr:hypothetical protein LTR97_009305 [Elasticomyces elasticus]KAK5728458.1 hypothetical protein LTR15_001594 [Elasticomyces elasticus]